MGKEFCRFIIESCLKLTFKAKLIGNINGRPNGN